MQLDLANGWTLSIVPDLTEGFYSIAAWQTSDNDPVVAADRKWFGFEGGRIECRTADIAEFLEAAAQVVKVSNVQNHRPARLFAQVRCIAGLGFTSLSFP